MVPFPGDPSPAWLRLIRGVLSVLALRMQSDSVADGAAGSLQMQHRCTTNPIMFRGNSGPQLRTEGQIMRKAILGFVVASLVTLPVVVLAQPGGSVTTSPLTQPAPTLGLPALVLLAALLAVVAGRWLRLAPKGIAGLALLVVMTSAGVGIASGAYEVVVDGEECLEVTVHPYDSYGPQYTLRNACANPVEVDALAPNCDVCETLPGTACEDVTILVSPVNACTVGTVLASNEVCFLPYCNGN
jgi:hypothetical protein